MKISVEHEVSPSTTECCYGGDFWGKDVNVNEISDHIKHGTLAQWIESWQMQMALEIENCRLSNETLRRENFGLKTTVRNLREKVDKFYRA